MANLSPDEKKKLASAFRKISDILTEQEAGRDTIKELVKETAEELDLNRRALRRAAKIFHKQNMAEEDQNHEEVKELIKSLGGK